jgi:hypothetical protein
MLDILAVGAKIEITTSSSSLFAQLLSSGTIDITNAMITDSDGASTITLDADKDIVCTGSMLDADRVTVSAGGMAVDCPGSPKPSEEQPTTGILLPGVVTPLAKGRDRPPQALGDVPVLSPGSGVITRR